MSEYIQTLPQNFIGDLSEAATTGVGFGTGLDGAVSQNQFDGFSAFSLPAWLADSSIALVVANVFDRQPPRIDDEVLTYSPLNSPANPRTIALVLNKRI